MSHRQLFAKTSKTTAKLKVWWSNIYLYTDVQLSQINPQLQWFWIRKLQFETIHFSQHCTS